MAAGLQTVGILTLLREHPTAMRPLFVAYHLQLTYEAMQELFTISFSVQGSNNREKEEVIMYFMNLLHDINSAQLLYLYMYAMLGYCMCV